MRVEKISISLPKPLKKHAQRQARRIARARSASRVNISDYVARLILQDREQTIQEAA